MTLPATSSEVNSGMVISREATKEKYGRGDPRLFGKFAILDPETTYTLPPRQTGNGIVDTFVHVFEQYLTYDVNAPLQDRQAEGILLTLIEEAPKVRADPNDYDVRANLMWCASQGLNGLIRCGVPGDWSSHAIGHELTALFEIDHGQSLAVASLGVLRHQRQAKAGKLVQYGRRVWGLEGLGDEQTIDAALARTEAFFQSVGVATRLSDYGLTPADCQAIVERFRKRGARLGERQAIGGEEIAEILALCA
jgi:NADP-dependent alcohol dehydrogenase